MEQALVPRTLGYWDDRLACFDRFGKPSGAGEQRLCRNAEARTDHSAQVFTPLRDSVERNRGTKINHHAGSTVFFVGGDSVGDAVGTYYDLFGEKRVTTRAPASGIVLAIHPGPIIPQGDVLIHIGLNPTQA